MQVVDEEISIRAPGITTEGPVIDRAAEGRDRAAVQDGGGEWQWGLGGRRRELPADPPRAEKEGDGPPGFAIGAIGAERIPTGRENGAFHGVDEALAAAFHKLDAGEEERRQRRRREGEEPGVGSWGPAIGGERCIDRGAGGDGTPSRKPVIKPKSFDGTGDLTDYLNHFDLCIKVNGWDQSEAGTYLGLSLDGPALKLLEGKKVTTAGGYRQLREALVSHYEPANQRETYKALLRTRQRLPGESLQTLQLELNKNMRMAYPEAGVKTIDALVLDRFLSILGDTRLRMWVYQSKPANCHDAVMTAVGAEAYLKHEADQRQEVRAADASVAEHMHSQGGRMDKLAEAIAALTSKVDQGGQGGQSSKKWPVNRACYHCNQEGHFKRECPLLMGRNRFGGGSAGPTPSGGPAHPAAPASEGIAANLQSPNQVAGN